MSTLSEPECASLAPFEGPQTLPVLEPRMYLDESYNEHYLFLATLQLPRRTKGQIYIDVYNGSFTVSGVTSETSERDRRFSRTVKLPKGADPKRIRASVAVDTLIVSIPRSPQARSLTHRDPEF